MMTNESMTPTDNGKVVLTAAQVKEAAKQLGALKSEEELLSSAKTDFEDEVEAEELASLKALEQANTQQAKVSGKNISELCEDDAYNFEIAIAAPAAYSKDFLKIDLIDSNYVARWGNRNQIRQAALVSKGFKFVKKDDVKNLDTLEMFLDAQDNFVYSDLVAMKVLKNVYYSGLRAAYQKSLQATNTRKLAQLGANFADSNLTSTLSASERAYMGHLKETTHKDVYNPNIGV